MLNPFVILLIGMWLQKLLKDNIDENTKKQKQPPQLCPIDEKNNIHFSKSRGYNFIQNKFC